MVAVACVVHSPQMVSEADTGRKCSVCGKPATHRQRQPHSVNYLYLCAEHASTGAEEVEMVLP